LSHSLTPKKKKTEREKNKIQQEECVKSNPQTSEEVAVVGEKLPGHGAKEEKKKKKKNKGRVSFVEK